MWHFCKQIHMMWPKDNKCVSVYPTLPKNGGERSLLLLLLLLLWLLLIDDDDDDDVDAVVVFVVD